MYNSIRKLWTSCIQFALRVNGVVHHCCLSVALQVSAQQIDGDVLSSCDHEVCECRTQHQLSLLVMYAGKARADPFRRVSQAVREYDTTTPTAGYDQSNTSSPKLHTTALGFSSFDIIPRSLADQKRDEEHAVGSKEDTHHRGVLWSDSTGDLSSASGASMVSLLLTSTTCYLCYSRCSCFGAIRRRTI